MTSAEAFMNLVEQRLGQVEALELSPGWACSLLRNELKAFRALQGALSESAEKGAQVVPIRP